MLMRVAAVIVKQIKKILFRYLKHGVSQWIKQNSIIPQFLTLSSQPVT